VRASTDDHGPQPTFSMMSKSTSGNQLQELEDRGPQEFLPQQLRNDERLTSHPAASPSNFGPSSSSMFGGGQSRALQILASLPGKAEFYGVSHR
jgi:hypothetical protein